MSKILSGVLGGILLVVALSTNPDRDAHVKALVPQTPEDPTGIPVPDNLAGGIISSLASQALDVDNYFICSVGRIEGKTVTIGLFGKVYVMDNFD